MTVMFCDLVGSTAIAESLDPETVREVLLAYRQACADVVKRLEGHIARYQGDGVMVYFGWPKAHEDDAQRAALAGLEIVRAIKELSVSARERYGIGLAVRVGIDTGLVVIADMGVDEWREVDDVVGEAPGLASRIQSLAEPNSVVVSWATNELLQGHFEMISLGGQQLRGFSRAVDVFRLVGPTSIESRFGARPWRATRLIGRLPEQEALATAWAQAVAGAPKAVLIEGEAGIGKSRLVECLRQRPSQRLTAQSRRRRYSPVESRGRRGSPKETSGRACSLPGGSSTATGATEGISFPPKIDSLPTSS